MVSHGSGDVDPVGRWIAGEEADRGQQLLEHEDNEEGGACSEPSQDRRVDVCTQLGRGLAVLPEQVPQFLAILGERAPPLSEEFRVVGRDGSDGQGRVRGRCDEALVPVPVFFPALDLHAADPGP